MREILEKRISELSDKLLDSSAILELIQNSGAKYGDFDDFLRDYRYAIGFYTLLELYDELYGDYRGKNLKARVRYLISLYETELKNKIPGK